MNKCHKLCIELMMYRITDQRVHDVYTKQFVYAQLFYCKHLGQNA